MTTWSVWKKMWFKIECVQSYFQVHKGCYFVRHLSNSSWNDAESDCANEGGHLWSINSHSEWIHVFRSLGGLAWRNYELDMKINTFGVKKSINVFIGLNTYSKVGKTSVQIYQKYLAD